MNKTQLIDALSARFEGNRKAAADALEAVLDTITREVARGEKVAITGFGSFEKRVREARQVRNPRTGEKLTSPRIEIPKFSPGADLRNVVAGLRELPAIALDTASAAIPGVKATKKSAKKAQKRAPAKKAASSTAAASTSSGSAKKTTAKKTTAKKSSPAKKTAAKKSSPAKKTAAKKSSPAKKTAAKKSSPAKKTAAKKSSPAKKTTAKKTTAKKTSPAKKATATKAPAKKSTS